MAFRIMSHGRLQEWVADEKGYFRDEGLDYVLVSKGDYSMEALQRDESGQIRTGAYETYEEGRDAAISCACHWAVSTAATNGAGKVVPSAYCVTPSAIMVPPESDVHRPEDLAGVEIGVGYHSGSHFATLQALEAVLGTRDIALSFEGPPNERLDNLLERKVAAATMWGVPLYIAEAFGFRKVLDTSFAIAFMADGEAASAEDVEKYLAGLKRAQMELDLHLEAHKHHHLKSVPEKYRDRVDVRTFGLGERIVFLPYTAEAYDDTQKWVQDRQIFTSPVKPADYGTAVLV